MYCSVWQIVAVLCCCALYSVAVPRHASKTFTPPPTQSTNHLNTLLYTATHCNTLDSGNALQHAATHCNTLQYTATHGNIRQHTTAHFKSRQRPTIHGNILQHHLATPCSTLQHPAISCNILQHSATLYNTLQRYNATLCNTCSDDARNEFSTHCNTITHCIAMVN